MQRYCFFCRITGWGGDLSDFLQHLFAIFTQSWCFEQITKAVSGNQHYENVPFEIPASWEWVRLEDVVMAVTDGDHQPPPQSAEGVPFLVISDVNTGRINFENARFVSKSYYDSLPYVRKATEGDILFTVTGSYGIVINVDTQREFCFQRHIGLIKTILCSRWLTMALQSQYVKQYCDDIATGTAQKTVSLGFLRALYIPIPPLAEQVRIVSEIEQWFKCIKEIENETIVLQDIVRQAKSKILSLAISGKLVTQDPNDEPAIDLLRRINPAFNPCDTSHYENLPENWCVCRLEDIVDYEQPTQYIVKSTNYSDEYRTPVLTAGKSFILGYTNETNGIYDKLPTIIFDDFTTDSRFVDFPFKVKSSAMKILQVNKEINIRYVAYFMGITRLVGDTHKRYWISEYSKIPIPIPPKQEQDRIVQRIAEIEDRLNEITAEL